MGLSRAPKRGGLCNYVRRKDLTIIMSEIQCKPHNLILDNRKKLCLSGIDDVSGFNEETVSLSTQLGGLVVRGSNLHISKLNLDTGEVEIEGTVNSLQYTQSRQNKSFMQRIFN